VVENVVMVQSFCVVCTVRVFSVPVWVFLVRKWWNHLFEILCSAFKSKSAARPWLYFMFEDAKELLDSTNDEKLRGQLSSG